MPWNHAPNHAPVAPAHWEGVVYVGPPRGGAREAGEEGPLRGDAPRSSARDAEEERWVQAWVTMTFCLAYELMHPAQTLVS